MHNLVEILKDYDHQEIKMYEYAQTLRKKSRLQILVGVAKHELESGKEINQVYDILDKEMQSRWKFVFTTRKQYLDDLNRILTNQYVLTT